MKGLLTALQNVTDEDGNAVTVDSSACIESFNLFYDDIADVWDTLDLASYISAL